MSLTRLVVSLCVLPVVSLAGNHPTVGVIRWDAWGGKNGIEGGDQTRVLEKTLAPEKFHARLPWFAKVGDDGSVTLEGSEPGIMEREIDYAADAGIDYFVFLDYGRESFKSRSLERFLSAKNVERMKFAVCFMIMPDFITEDNWDRTVEKYVVLMTNARWLRVCGNRPLAFTFAVGDDAACQGKRFAKLRSAACAAGLNPYFVVFQPEPLEAWRKWDSANLQGYDAMGSYAPMGNLAKGCARYCDFAREGEDCLQGEALLRGVSCVPAFMTGWQKDPRKEYVPYWEKDQEYHRQVGFPDLPTADEIAAELRRTLDFVTTHPSVCPANTLTIYAWNEHDEGGWLCPTRTKDGRPDTTRLDAVRRVLRPLPEVRSVDEVAPDRGELWRVSEWTFVSTNADVAATGADLEVDMVFEHGGDGMRLVRPAFWDGGRVYRVRFAPPAAGRWTWRTNCRNDSSLDGRTGTFEAVPYTGTQRLYQKGFVRAEKNLKYLMYADGTPFFYLGDTHWSMYAEDIDSAHFKVIVDKRVRQGFTVYQSEPISAPFDLTDGKIDAADIEGFRRADRYYQYIADAGLVHANAEFFYASKMTPALASDDRAIDCLCRYWVARFGAFPVMWTLAQEIDNDFYSNRRASWNFYSTADNPWLKVAASLHRHDAYGHPLSGHQESTYETTVTGEATNKDARRPDRGRSIFADPDFAARVGHNWWAAQWSPSLVANRNGAVAAEYWQSERPAVNYEGRYCHLWTKDFGARAQGWISYLNGFCGYGYGAADIWLYNGRYEMDKTSRDGYEEITPEDKKIKWYDAVDLPSAQQMKHLRRFLERLPWWELEPDMGREKYFSGDDHCVSSVAARGSDLFVLYLNATNTVTGSLKGAKAKAPYQGLWYNPRTGEESSLIALTADGGGRIVLPRKPDANDWVLLVNREAAR